jgi:hypothetical protein
MYVLQLLEPSDALNLLLTDNNPSMTHCSFQQQTQVPAREEGRRESTGSTGRLSQSSPATLSAVGRLGPSVSGQDAPRGLGWTRMDEVRGALDALAAGPRR